MTTKETTQYLCNIAKEINNITGNLYDEILSLYQNDADSPILPYLRDTSKYLREQEAFAQYCQYDDQIFGQMCFLSQALSLWREDKILYSFDEDMEEILVSQSLDANQDDPLPIDVLNALPYSSFFIKTAHTPYRPNMGLHHLDKNNMPPELREVADRLSKMEAVGFFVNRELSKVNEKMTEVIGFTTVLSHRETGQLKIASHIIPLCCRTLAEAVEIEIADSQEALDEEMRMNETGRKRAFNLLYQQFSEALQLLLYLCVKNKEEKQDEENAVIYRKASSPRFSKFKPREVKELVLGSETGSLIRTLKKNQDTIKYIGADSTNHTGKTKAPHPRAGHYHHYWIGKGRKELVLKWVAPTFVNKHLSAQYDSTIIHVENNK